MKAYKNKKVDGRTKLAKLLKEKAVVLTTKKMYDSELPDWTNELVISKGFTITNKALTRATAGLSTGVGGGRVPSENRPR